MQPPTAYPRDGLTAEQVTYLIQDAPAVQVDKGLELMMDLGLQVAEDISADLAGGSVARDNDDTLHGTAQLEITRELDWGQAIVRPYMTLTDGSTTARFNLGCYFTSTSGADLAESLPSYSVVGYDILHALDDPVGETYAVAAGTGYLAAVEEILIEAGYSQYVIDQSAQALVLPSTRVWPIDENTTRLSILNELLAAIGYRQAWSDWDGRVRCDAYLSPAGRAPEWVYTVDNASMLSPQRAKERDLFKAPNRWVAIRSNDIDAPAPVEGAGIWTWVNETTGPTSVEARGGRVITRILNLDAADQASLVAQAQIEIDADMRIPTTIKVPSFPNPLHWHLDRMTVDDPALGPVLEVQGASWTLPLDGGDMSHEWRVL